MARIANFPAHVVAEAENLAVALEDGEPLQAHFAKSDGRQRTTELGQLQSVNDRPASDDCSCPSNGYDGHKRKIADVVDGGPRGADSPADKRLR